MARDDTVTSIAELVKSLIRKDRAASATWVQGTFVSAATIDPNLSNITVFGKTMSNVRKLASVGTLTAGQQVLCAQGDGVGVIIIGVILGNINNI